MWLSLSSAGQAIQGRRAWTLTKPSPELIGAQPGDFQHHNHLSKMLLYHLVMGADAHLGECLTHPAEHGRAHAAAVRSLPAAYASSCRLLLREKGHAELDGVDVPLDVHLLAAPYDGLVVI